LDVELPHAGFVWEGDRFRPSGERGGAGDREVRVGETQSLAPYPELRITSDDFGSVGAAVVRIAVRTRPTRSCSSGNLVLTYLTGLCVALLGFVGTCFTTRHGLGDRTGLFRGDEFLRSNEFLPSNKFFEGGDASAGRSSNANSFA
jgi:hypothetical protein